MRIRTSEKALNIFINVSLAIIAFMTIYPLWFVVIASVSSPSAISNGQVILLPEGLNIDAYVKLFQTKRIWTGYKNSILYTGASILLDLAVQIPCAFALSRRTLPFRRFFNILFIIPMYFTGGIIPTYIWLSKLGMVDSPLALIVPACVSVFNLIIAKNYFASNIPDTLVEAARIDGCGYLGCLFKIMLPSSVSGITTAALFSFLGHWKAYQWPLIVTNSTKLRTLPIGLKFLVQESSSEYQVMMAAAVLAVVPVLIVYSIYEKQLVKSITLTGIK